MLSRMAFVHRHIGGLRFALGVLSIRMLLCEGRVVGVIATYTPLHDHVSANKRGGSFCGSSAGPASGQQNMMK